MSRPFAQVQRGLPAGMTVQATASADVHHTDLSRLAGVASYTRTNTADRRGLFARFFARIASLFRRTQTPISGLRDHRAGPDQPHAFAFRSAAGQAYFLPRIQARLVPAQVPAPDPSIEPMGQLGEVGQVGQVGEVNEPPVIEQPEASVEVPISPEQWRTRLLERFDAQHAKIDQSIAAYQLSRDPNAASHAESRALRSAAIQDIAVLFNAIAQMRQITRAQPELTEAVASMRSKLANQLMRLVDPSFAPSLPPVASQAASEVADEDLSDRAYSMEVNVDPDFDLRESIAGHLAALETVRTKDSPSSALDAQLLARLIDHSEKQALMSRSMAAEWLGLNLGVLAGDQDALTELVGPADLPAGADAESIAKRLKRLEQHGLAVNNLLGLSTHKGPLSDAALQFKKALGATWAAQLAQDGLADNIEKFIESVHQRDFARSRLQQLVSMNAGKASPLAAVSVMRYFPTGKRLDAQFIQLARDDGNGDRINLVIAQAIALEDQAEEHREMLAPGWSRSGESAIGRLTGLGGEVKEQLARGQKLDDSLGDEAIAAQLMQRAADLAKAGFASSKEAERVQLQVQRTFDAVLESRIGRNAGRVAAQTVPGSSARQLAHQLARNEASARRWQTLLQTVRDASSEERDSRLERSVLAFDTLEEFLIQTHAELLNQQTGFDQAHAERAALKAQNRAALKAIDPTKPAIVETARRIAALSQSSSAARDEPLVEAQQADSNRIALIDTDPEIAGQIRQIDASGDPLARLFRSEGRLGTAADRLERPVPGSTRSMAQLADAICRIDSARSEMAQSAASLDWLVNRRERLVQDRLVLLDEVGFGQDARGFLRDALRASIATEYVEHHLSDVNRRDAIAFHPESRREQILASLAEYGVTETRDPLVKVEIDLALSQVIDEPQMAQWLKEAKAGEQHLPQAAPMAVAAVPVQAPKPPSDQDWHSAIRSLDNFEKLGIKIGYNGELTTGRLTQLLSAGSASADFAMMLGSGYQCAVKRKGETYQLVVKQNTSVGMRLGMGLGISGSPLSVNAESLTKGKGVQGIALSFKNIDSLIQCLDRLRTPDTDAPQDLLEGLIKVENLSENELSLTGKVSAGVKLGGVAKAAGLRQSNPGLDAVLEDTLLGDGPGLKTGLAGGIEAVLSASATTADEHAGNLANLKVTRKAMWSVGLGINASLGVMLPAAANIAMGRIPTDSMADYRRSNLSSPSIPLIQASAMIGKEVITEFEFELDKASGELRDAKYKSLYRLLPGMTADSLAVLLPQHAHLFAADSPHRPELERMLRGIPEYGATFLIESVLPQPQVDALNVEYRRSRSLAAVDVNGSRSALERAHAAHLKAIEQLGAHPDRFAPGLVLLLDMRGESLAMQMNLIVLKMSATREVQHSTALGEIRIKPQSASSVFDPSMLDEGQPLPDIEQVIDWIGLQRES